MIDEKYSRKQSHDLKISEKNIEKTGKKSWMMFFVENQGQTIHRSKSLEINKRKREKQTNRQTDRVSGKVKVKQVLEEALLLKSK